MRSRSIGRTRRLFFARKMHHLGRAIRCSVPGPTRQSDATFAPFENALTRSVRPKSSSCGTKRFRPPRTEQGDSRETRGCLSCHNIVERHAILGRQTDSVTAMSRIDRYWKQRFGLGDELQRPGIHVVPHTRYPGDDLVFAFVRGASAVLSVEQASVDRARDRVRQADTSVARSGSSRDDAWRSGQSLRRSAV